MTTVEQAQAIEGDGIIRRLWRFLSGLIVSRPNPDYGYTVVGTDDFPAHTLPPDATPDRVAEMLDKFEETWPTAIKSLQQVARTDDPNAANGKGLGSAS